MHFHGSLPAGFETVRLWTIYDLVDDWILNSSIKPGRQLLMYLIFIAIVAAIMVWVTRNLTPFPDVGVGIYIGIQIGLLFLTIVVHETCHAIVIIKYGGYPTFGAKWLKGLGPVVYVTTKGYFGIRAYRKIAAAPLVVISVVCFVGVFIGAGWWVIVPFVFNAIGAGGDLLSLRVLLKYPQNYLIKDTQDGFVAYSDTVNQTVSGQVTEPV